MTINPKTALSCIDPAGRLTPLKGQLTKENIHQSKITLGLHFQIHNDAVKLVVFTTRRSCPLFGRTKSAKRRERERRERERERERETLRLVSHGMCLFALSNTGFVQPASSPYPCCLKRSPHSKRMSPDRFLTSPQAQRSRGFFVTLTELVGNSQPLRAVRAEPTAGVQSAQSTPGSVPGSNSFESLLDGVISDVVYCNEGGLTANAVGSRQSRTPGRPLRVRSRRTRPNTDSLSQRSH